MSRGPGRCPPRPAPNITRITARLVKVARPVGRIVAGQSGMNQQVTAARLVPGMCQGMHPYRREEA